jgi:hypothetical protein
MASTYLSKTFSSGDTKTWTWSGWVKKNKTQSFQTIFSAGTNANSINIDGGSGTENSAIGIDGFYNGTRHLRYTSSAYRDVNGWYHVVVAVDTTQATDSNRIKLWVNGSQVGLDESIAGSWPAQNSDGVINSNVVHSIGRRENVPDGYFDGSITHVYFIDGTAYDADTFGEYDSTTGIWTAKFGPSVTYGTNGFFLKFENSGAFGTDSSGNGNNFTVNGTMTQNIDTPNNVFATLNPLMGGLSSVTYSNGNTTATFAAPSTWYFTPSTLAASQGKWYAEVKVGAVGTETSIGIIPMETVSLQQGAASDYMGKESDSIGYVNNGQLYKTNSVQETTSTYTTGDIIGMAFDLDGNSIQFYKNGSSVGSAISLTSGLNYTVGVSGYNSSSSNVNFGNGYFGTTAVSSAQNPDDGIGIFEYAVPTGYKSLCTKSINAQEYD